MTARRSIRLELTLFIAALVLVITGGLSLLVLSAQEKSLKEELRLRGATIAGGIAGSIADFVLTDDRLSVASILTDGMKNKGVKFIIVTDENGIVKADDTIKKEGSVYGIPAADEVLATGDAGVTVYNDSEHGRIIHFTAPVIAKGKLKLGTVHAGISYSVVDDVLKAAYLRVVIISLGALLLGIIGAFLLSGAITKPVKQLAEGARIIGTGDLGYVISVKSGNELGELAESFNKMTSDLKAAQDSLVKKQRLERELEVAREIQLSLIPKDIAKVEGYEIAAYYNPAREVGGDYYDVIPFGGDKTGFVVGDVSGKGVPAAFIMTMARSIIHSEASPEFSSVDILKKLNATIYPDMRDGMFVTVFYGVLDHAKNEIDLASAGHNDTLVYRVKTGQVEKYNPKGFPIGMDSGQRFDKVVKSEKVKINKGDSVVMFTDGITEAMNGKNEEFGQEKMEDIIASSADLSAREAVDRIIKAVEKFAAGAEQSDDIAVIILKKIK